MAQLARVWRVGITAAALLAGALAGCGSSPPIDQYYGTDKGADFRAPIVDASSNGDMNVTPTSGAAGQDGAAGAGGAAGAAGAAGQSGTDGAAGSTGSAGAGA